MDYFADEYVRGRTPNPCVVCNDRLKFGKLLDYADAVGADVVATGHYARVEGRDGQRRLCRAVDHRKDQSYFLFGVGRPALERMLLPVGHLTKDEVRRQAVRFGLPVCDKPDSVEICFVPDGDYARLVRIRRPDAFRPGDVLDADGTVLGRHDTGDGPFDQRCREALACIQRILEALRPPSPPVEEQDEETG